MRDISSIDNTQYQKHLEIEARFLEEFEDIYAEASTKRDEPFELNAEEFIQAAKQNIKDIIEETKAIVEQLSLEDIESINRFSLVKVDQESIDNFLQYDCSILVNHKVETMAAFRSDELNLFFFNAYDYMTAPEGAYKKLTCHEVGHLIISEEKSILRNPEGTVGFTHGPLQRLMDGFLLRHEENTVDKISDILCPQIRYGELRSEYYQVRALWPSFGLEKRAYVRNGFLLFGQLLHSRLSNSTHPSTILREIRSKHRCNKLWNTAPAFKI